MAVAKLPHSAELRPAHITRQNERVPLVNWLVGPLLLILFGGAAIFVDVPAARFLGEHSHINVLSDFFSVAETFGHGYGVAILVIGVCCFDRSALGKMHRVFAGSLGAGIAADVVKMCVIRARPSSVDLASSSVLETFGSFFPFMSAGMGGQSFPSAHSATAVGFAIVLAVYYPQSRWYVGFVAAAACLSRAVVQAHFLSDVFAGAAIGWMVGQLAVGQAFVPATIQQFLPMRGRSLVPSQIASTPLQQQSPSASSDAA